MLQELVKVIRPLNTSSQFDFTPFVSEIYSCTLVRLKATDIDQEVKERAISTMGQIICNLGDCLHSELPVCLPIFLDRLKNEITRLTTVKALTKIAGSPLRIDLPIIVSVVCICYDTENFHCDIHTPAFSSFSLQNEVVATIGMFLRKNQRALKLSTLQLLDCLIKNYHNVLYVDLLQQVTAELPPLLDECDLHIAQWTMVILKSIAEMHPGALQDIKTGILPQIMVLVKSPLLQGVALQSMLDFLQALVMCNLPEVSYNDLLQMLLYPISTLVSNPAGLHKQAFYSLAKCVAAITVVCPNHAIPVVRQFVQDAQMANSDFQHVFALLVIGEIGRSV